MIPAIPKGTVMHHPILGEVFFHGPHETLENVAYCLKGSYRHPVEMALLSVRPWPKPVWDAFIPDGVYAVQVADTWGVRRAQGGAWYMVDAKQRARGPALKETVKQYVKIV